MKSVGQTLLKLGIHLLFAVPLAWYGMHVVLSAEGGVQAVPRLLAGFALVSAAGLIVAPAIAALLADPSGIVYYPEKRLKSEDVVCAPALMCLRSRDYEGAIKESRKFLKKSRNRAGIYARMIEIAVNHMRNFQLAKTLVEEGVKTTRSKRKMKALRQFHANLVSRIKYDREYRPKIAIDPDELARELEEKLRRQRGTVKAKPSQGNTT